LAEELPEPAHELSALRGGPRAPYDQSVPRRIDAVVVLGARGGADSPQRRARGGVDRLQHLAAAVACGRCSEVLEERGGLRRVRPTPLMLPPIRTYVPLTM